MKKIFISLLIFIIFPLIINSASLTCTYDDIVSNLNVFYNTLENKSTFLVSTSKFLCTSSPVSCDTSLIYDNIGLLNLSEYDVIGGNESYLSSTKSYWTMTEISATAYQITSTGSELIEKTTVSGIKPVVYVNNSIEVNGSGSYSNPFTFIEP